MKKPSMFGLATCLIFLLALSINSVSSAGGTRLYRWVDKEGRVHYTDTIPPSEADQGHAVLNNEGVRVQTVPPAKSAEAVAEETELARLRKEQQALIEKQRAADQFLLQRFRSEDDIVMARDGKIAAINVMIQVTRNNVGRQQRALAKLRSTAANLERAGKPIPPQLTQDIANIEQSVRNAYAGILDRQTQEKAVYDTFDKDLKRFRELKRLPVPPKGKDEKAARPPLDNIVLCSTSSECDRLWKKAVAYVRKNAATPVPASNSTILVTAPPAAAEQISMILSRIQDKKDDGATLFLDLQCQQSIRGQQACSSNAAKQLIKGFRPAVTGQDGTSKS
jgi:hypothetical protein